MPTTTTTPTLGRGSPGGENVCHAYAYTSIPVPHTPCHALNQSQADAIQLCLHGEGLSICAGWDHPQ